MRRRVFVVVGDGGWRCCWRWRWCWRWCWCLWCWWCWWCWCWGRLAGGKLRPLVARVQHSLGLSHAPIAVAELDDAVRGFELLHVPSRLHRALKGITTTRKRTAPKRLEIPAETHREPTNDRSPRHLEENAMSSFGVRTSSKTFPSTLKFALYAPGAFRRPGRRDDWKPAVFSLWRHARRVTLPRARVLDGSRPRAHTRVYRRLRLHATCSVGLLLAPVTAV
jgi:hypothetical protein